MFVSIYPTSAFLFYCLVQSACLGLTATPTTASVEQRIGTLSDVAAYSKNLAPHYHDQIFSICKDQSFYKCFLERIGADPSLPLAQLAADQKQAWDQVYFLFVDLYHIAYEALIQIVMQDNRGCKPDELSEEEPEQVPIDFMKAIFLYISSCSDKNSVALDDASNYGKLVATIQEYYINPLNSYLAGGNWSNFQAPCDKERGEVYRAFVNVIEKEAKKLSEEEEEASSDCV